MAERVAERYRPGDRVEIHLDMGRGAEWLPGVVIRPDHPGVWVQVGDGRRWFVTNGRRIRMMAAAANDS